MCLSCLNEAMKVMDENIETLKDYLDNNTYDCSCYDIDFHKFMLFQEQTLKTICLFKIKKSNHIGRCDKYQKLMELEQSFINMYKSEMQNMIDLIFNNREEISDGNYIHYMDQLNIINKNFDKINKDFDEIEV
jgi:hypothetical protein